MAVITRKMWRAGSDKAPRISLPVSRLFLHHTVTDELIGVNAARTVQRIALGRGFIDISYSWLVDIQGNQIEGRGWGRQGAHTRGFNSSAHAICLIGNFDIRKPSRAMILAAADLVRKHDQYGPGRITHGHRDVDSTACPGKYAYAAIDDINRLAKQSGPIIITPKEEDVFPDKGDKGIEVRFWQIALRFLKLYKDKIDGVFGPNMAAAVLAARKSQGSKAKSGDSLNPWAAVQILTAMMEKVAKKVVNDLGIRDIDPSELPSVEDLVDETVDEIQNRLDG